MLPSISSNSKQQNIQRRSKIQHENQILETAPAKKIHIEAEKTAENETAALAVILALSLFNIMKTPLQIANNQEDDEDIKLKKEFQNFVKKLLGDCGESELEVGSTTV